MEFQIVTPFPEMYAVSPALKVASPTSVSPEPTAIVKSLADPPALAMTFWFCPETIEQLRDKGRVAVDGAAIVNLATSSATVKVYELVL